MTDIPSRKERDEWRKTFASGGFVDPAFGRDLLDTADALEAERDEAVRHVQAFADEAVGHTGSVRMLSAETLRRLAEHSSLKSQFAVMEEEAKRWRDAHQNSAVDLNPEGCLGGMWLSGWRSAIQQVTDHGGVSYGGAGIALMRASDYDAWEESLAQERVGAAALRKIVEFYRSQEAEEVADLPAGDDTRPGHLENLAEIDAALAASPSEGLEAIRELIRCYDSAWEILYKFGATPTELSAKTYREVVRLFGEESS